MGKVVKLIGNILFVIAILLALILVGVRVAGITPYAVLSGSMEPTYMTGSIVYVKNVDYHTLEEGDPVTFMLDEDTIVTHRIVEVIPDDEDKDTIRYRTKGDNNDVVDGGLVHCKNVIGKPVYTIPYLGYFITYVQQPPGLYFMLAACVLILLLAFLPDLFDEDRKKNKEGKKN